MMLEDVTVSLITERRVSRPWGLAGGQPGAPGDDWLPGGDESRAERLPDKCTIRMKAGGVLRMLTPGGGGWGTPPDGSPEAVVPHQLEGDAGSEGGLVRRRWRPPRAAGVAGAGLTGDPVHPAVPGARPAVLQLGQGRLYLRLEPALAVSRTHAGSRAPSATTTRVDRTDPTAGYVAGPWSLSVR